MLDLPWLDIEDSDLVINESEPLNSPLLEKFILEEHRFYLERAHNASHFMARKIQLDANKELVSNLIPKKAGVKLWKLAFLLADEMVIDDLNLYHRIETNELSELELIGFMTRTLAHPFDKEELIFNRDEYR